MSDAPSTAVLIDVVVLCFAKSELKTLVGTDALRTVLEGSQREMFPEPGVMVLQPVFELLESQPGFDKNKAIAPMCRIKSWEGRLKTKVQMPEGLDTLDKATIENQAMGCSAFDSDLDKLLKIPVATGPLTRVIESGSVSDKHQQRESNSNRKAKIAMIAAVVGLLAAMVSIYLTFRGNKNNVVQLSPSDISDKIPLSNVRKSPGGIIVGTLADPKWLQKPEADRHMDMVEAAGKIRAQGGISFTIIDKKGAPLGVVQVRKDPIVTFVGPH